MRIIAALFSIVIVIALGVSVLGNDADTARVAEEKTKQLLESVPAGAPQAANAIMSDQANAPQAMKATLETNMGPITIELLGDDAPQTVANFEKLARAGFYDGTKFHRVIAGFMIQGGDPQSKDDSLQARWGTGGPGYTFADEIHANNKNVIGTISMANAGPNTNGSQFFINTADNNFLDGKHTVFGKVVAGMETVKKIEATKTGPNDRPQEPMVIQRVTLE